MNTIAVARTFSWDVFKGSFPERYPAHAQHVDGIQKMISEMLALFTQDTRVVCRFLAEAHTYDIGVSLTVRDTGTFWVLCKLSNDEAVKFEITTHENVRLYLDRLLEIKNRTEPVFKKPVYPGLAPLSEYVAAVQEEIARYKVQETYLVVMLAMWVLHARPPYRKHLAYAAKKRSRLEELLRHALPVMFPDEESAVNGLDDTIRLGFVSERMLDHSASEGVALNPKGHYRLTQLEKKNKVA